MKQTEKIKKLFKDGFSIADIAYKTKNNVKDIYPIIEEMKEYKKRKRKAHYICNELREPLAELILKVMEKKMAGGYVKTYERKCVDE